MAKITVIVEVSELVIVGGFGLFLLAVWALCWNPSSYGRKALEFFRKLFKGFMKWLVGGEKTEVSEANPNVKKEIKDGVLKNKPVQKKKVQKKKVQKNSSGLNTKKVSSNVKGEIKDGVLKNKPVQKKKVQRNGSGLDTKKVSSNDLGDTRGQWILVKKFRNYEIVDADGDQPVSKTNTEDQKNAEDVARPSRDRDSDFFDDKTPLLKLPDPKLTDDELDE